MQTISNNKIIILVVFFSVAIITSLFLFYSQHKPEFKTTLTGDAGTVFPVARDIKSFDLIADDENAFTQKNFLNHWTLLLFGFTHCAHVCPTSLEMLNRIYQQLQPTYPNLQVVMVSLDPDRDTTKVLKTYMHSYNPQFIGVTGKIDELRKLQSQLGIYAERQPSTSPTQYQIQHTSSILLINPQGQWAANLKFGLNPNQFIAALNESITTLQAT